MIAIIIFFAKLNYNNANDMNQIAIFEHLSSRKYRTVLNVGSKISNIFYNSIFWIALKFIESNFSWYVLGSSR